MVKVRVLWILIKLLLKDDHKKCGVDFIFRIAEHTVLCILCTCRHPVSFGTYLLNLFGRSPFTCRLFRNSEVLRQLQSKCNMRLHGSTLVPLEV